MMAPVLYPCSLKMVAIVGKLDPIGLREFIAPCWLGYKDVKIEANDVSVQGDGAIAFSKRTPSWASRSMLGLVLRS